MLYKFQDDVRTPAVSILKTHSQKTKNEFDAPHLALFSNEACGGSHNITLARVPTKHATKAFGHLFDLLIRLIIDLEDSCSCSSKANGDREWKTGTGNTKVAKTRAERHFDLFSLHNRERSENGSYWNQNLEGCSNVWLSIANSGSWSHKAARTVTYPYINPQCHPWTYTFTSKCMCVCECAGGLEHPLPLLSLYLLSVLLFALYFSVSLSLCLYLF